MQSKLSDLTEEVVDRFYNLGATPVAEPTFVWLVGSPGAGKSSGHAAAIEAGYLPAGNYATVNLDLLLESLLPFRAASAMGYYVKHGIPGSSAKFSSLFAYGTRKENLGLFKWYNTARNNLERRNKGSVEQLNAIREKFRGLNEKEAAKKLTELNEEAIERAIDRSIPIVYETTLSLNKKGVVEKVENVMEYLKKHGPQYRVVFYYIGGSPEDVAARIHARQEYGMPYEDMPFYRYVLTDERTVKEMIEKTKVAFDALSEQYREKAMFREIENPLDPSRLTRDPGFHKGAYLEKLVSAYGSLPNAADAPTTVSKKESKGKTRTRKTASPEAAAGAGDEPPPRRSTRKPKGERRRNTVLNTLQ